MECGVSVSECPCLQAIQRYMEWWGGGRRKEGLKVVGVELGKSGEGGRCGDREELRQKQGLGADRQGAIGGDF
jgi:hypothetical protein